MTGFEMLARNARNELIEAHYERAMRLVRSVAGLNAGLREDLEDVVLEALVDAAERYDDSRARFWTFASIRLRGAMIDYFRRRKSEISVDAQVLIGIGYEEPALRDCPVTDVARAVLAASGLPQEIGMRLISGDVSMRQAAHELGICYDTLRRRMKRYRLFIKQILKDENGVDYGTARALGGRTGLVDASRVGCRGERRRLDAATR